MLGDVLICFSKEIIQEHWPNWDHHLVNFIHHHTPFQWEEWWEKECKCDRNRQAHVLLICDAGTNGGSPSPSAALFHSLTFVSERDTSDILLVLPTTDQGASMVILQFAKVMYSNFTFRNWSTIHRMSLGSPWAYQEVNKGQKPLCRLLPISLQCGRQEWHSNTLQVWSEPVSIASKKLHHVPFSRAQFLGEWLQRRPGGRFTVSILNNTIASFLVKTLLQSRNSRTTK